MNNFIIVVSIAISIIGILISILLYSNAVVKKKISQYDKLKSYDLDIKKIINPSLLYFINKRLFDIVFSLVSLIVFLPLFIFFSIIIFCSSKGPVIIKRKRIGYKGKIFSSYKFRTMYIANSGNIEEILSNKDQRITKIGRYLRASNIDELPSLINVLLGDMSLVGRSHILDFDITSKRLSPEQKEFLLNIKPGILNLWILSSYKMKFDLDSIYDFDFYYAQNRSFFLDLKIIIDALIFTSGISSGY